MRGAILTPNKSNIAGAETTTGKPGVPKSDLITFPAQPHALPFRTILGEYRERRALDLAEVSVKIDEIQTLDPFYNPDKRLESDPVKFGNHQWKLLQQQIQISEDAYRDLALKKEALAAISARDSLVLVADQRRKIAEILRKEIALDKVLKSAPERKEELRAEKAALQSKLLEERQTKKKAKLQQRIFDGYTSVLEAEKKCKAADQPLLRVLHGMNGSAVCLSGGGIRSASFCLGVLQGLARFSVKRDPKPGPVLPPSKLGDSALGKLDYLSTVSGGGYIGSWLMAWATHAQYLRVVELLARPAATSSDPEPQPIRHLREYTSYLTPSYGFTLDTMTLIAIVLRNLLLNWMILVPAVVVLFCAPELIFQISASVPLGMSEWFSRYSVGMASVLMTWVTLFVAWSTFRPASATKNPESVGRTSREMVNLVLPLTLAAWILAEGWAWASHDQPSIRSTSLLDIAWHFSLFPILPLMAMAVARVVSVWPRLDLKNESPLRRKQLDDSSDAHDQQKSDNDDGSEPSHGRYAWAKIVDWWKVSWALIAPLLIAALVALALAACAKYIPMPDWSMLGETQGPHIFVWLCIPLVWSLLLLGSSLLSGLLSGIESEEEREWWARAGGLMMMVQLGWIALMGVAFYADHVLHALWTGILAAAGLTSGYVGSLAGLSAATSSGLKKVNLKQLTSAQKWLAKYDLLAPTACAISILCIWFALAGMTSGLRVRAYSLLQNGPEKSSVSSCEKERLRSIALNADHRSSVTNTTYLSQESGISSAIRQALVAIHVDSCFLGAAPLAQAVQSEGEQIPKLQKDFVANLLIALIAFLIAMLANEFINVNTFSLHGMYRMRLTRAYLGASNFARHADNFTDFDKSDNMHESDVVYHGAPLHIINTALNVVATSNLAWQQRKAESFTFSPLSVGSWRLGYLPTSLYGGSRGVTLGTAMSISGAAFNPNMGYNSSPLVTLLMTFFNARLGWWLPNPIWPLLQAQKANADNSTLPASALTLKSLLQSSPSKAGYLRSPGPTRALFTLIYEALGRTDDKYKWIELTDGGHFENLALYEMVMRRCRYIILVDSDADSDFEFEDLGNAARKIEIDFGVPVRFPKYPKGLPMKPGIDGSNVYYAVGEILYDCVDRDPASPLTAEKQGINRGTLLYIKPCLNGSEPVGVRAYANAHPNFPHESTINQFFNESQFESYRNLGSWEFASIVREFLHDPPPPGNDIGTLFDRISNAVEPESANQKDVGLWGILKTALGFSKKGDSESSDAPDKGPIG